MFKIIINYELYSQGLIQSIIGQVKRRTVSGVFVEGA